MPEGKRAVMPRPYEITTESFEVPPPGPGADRDRRQRDEFLSVTLHW